MLDSLPRQSETQLVKERQMLIRERLQFPPGDELQELIFDYRELILDVQIETARRRKDLLTNIAMSRKREIIKRVDNVETTTYSSFFGWEKVDKAYLDGINDRETKAIQYFTDLINKTRNEQTAIPTR